MFKHNQVVRQTLDFRGEGFVYNKTLDPFGEYGLELIQTPPGTLWIAHIDGLKVAFKNLLNGKYVRGIGEGTLYFKGL